MFDVSAWLRFCRTFAFRTLIVGIGVLSVVALAFFVASLVVAASAKILLTQLFIGFCLSVLGVMLLSLVICAAFFFYNKCRKKPCDDKVVLLVSEIKNNTCSVVYQVRTLESENFSSEPGCLENCLSGDAPIYSVEYEVKETKKKIVFQQKNIVPLKLPATLREAKGRFFRYKACGSFLVIMKREIKSISFYFIDFLQTKNRKTSTITVNLDKGNGFSLVESLSWAATCVNHVITLGLVMLMVKDREFRYFQCRFSADLLSDEYKKEYKADTAFQGSDLPDKLLRKAKQVNYFMLGSGDLYGSFLFKEDEASESREYTFVLYYFYKEEDIWQAFECIHCKINLKLWYRWSQYLSIEFLKGRIAFMHIDSKFMIKTRPSENRYFGRTIKHVDFDCADLFFVIDTRAIKLFSSQQKLKPMVFSFENNRKALLFVHAKTLIRPINNSFQNNFLYIGDVTNNGRLIECVGGIKLIYPYEAFYPEFIVPTTPLNKTLGLAYEIAPVYTKNSFIRSNRPYQKIRTMYLLVYGYMKETLNALREEKGNNNLAVPSVVPSAVFSCAMTCYAGYYIDHSVAFPKDIVVEIKPSATTVG